MQTMVEYFLGLFPSWLTYLSGLLIVPGVSVLGFLLGAYLIYLFLNNFLFRAR